MITFNVYLDKYIITRLESERMGISLEVTTDVEETKIFQRLARFPGLVEKELDKQAKAEAFDIRDVAKTYDAAPKPSYSRTGHMSRQTVAFRNSGGNGWSAEMRAPYSIWVRGNASGEGQAFMHVGRWRTFKSIVRGAAVKRGKRISAAIKQAKRKAGLK